MGTRICQATSYLSPGRRRVLFDHSIAFPNLLLLVLLLLLLLVLPLVSSLLSNLLHLLFSASYPSPSPLLFHSLLLVVRKSCERVCAACALSLTQGFDRMARRLTVPHRGVNLGGFFSAPARRQLPALCVKFLPSVLLPFCFYYYSMGLAPQPRWPFRATRILPFHPLPNML